MIDSANLKQQIERLLTSTPDQAWSMDELSEHFKIDRWQVQKAVSQLQDEGKVFLRVWQRKIYANIIRR